MVQKRGVIGLSAVCYENPLSGNTNRNMRYMPQQIND